MRGKKNNAEGEQGIANPPNNSKLAFPSSNLEQLKITSLHS